MRLNFRTPLAAILIAVGVHAHAKHWEFAPGFGITPTIHGYRLTHIVTDAACAPKKHASYRIAYALTQGPSLTTEVNFSRDHVARMVDVSVPTGVPVSHLGMIANAYGDATSLARNDEAYPTEFDVDNPTRPMIAVLRKAGADVTVFARTVAENHLGRSAADKPVTIALSGMTSVVTSQQRGYAFMSMHADAHGCLHALHTDAAPSLVATLD